MTRKNKNIKIPLVISILIAVSFACGSLQFGVVTPTAVEKTSSAATAPKTEVEEVSQPDTPNPPEEAVNSAATETSPEPSSAVDVIAWLGHIASLPEGSQYDDAVVLSPEGTGEFGLTGATPEIEAEIRSLRDAEGSNEFVHFWGALHCNVPDYNNCQLVVDKMQYGANYSEENFKNWKGTIKSFTFNGGDSSIFERSGDFPMWYSIRASRDPEMQAKIENVRDTGALVEVSGKLLVGIPDVNGTRIEPGSLEVIEVAVTDPAEIDLSPEVVSDWPLFVNERYGYQFQYPPQAIISLHGPEGFSADEKPADMTADQYMDSLLKEYTNQLCIQIEYSLGWIYIAAPPNKERLLTPCGPTGLGAGEIIEKIETIAIGEELFQASGVEFKLQVMDSEGNPINGENLDLHGEMFSFELEDGTRIRFGAASRHDATYEDYLMKTKKILLQIISTYEKLP